MYIYRGMYPVILALDGSASLAHPREGAAFLGCRGGRPAGEGTAEGAHRGKGEHEVETPLPAVAGGRVEGSREEG